MKFTIYPDRDGDWRWRLRARNGRIIADSGEAYDSEGNARRAVTRLIRAFDEQAPVIEVIG